MTTPGRGRGRPRKDAQIASPEKPEEKVPSDADRIVELEAKLALLLKEKEEEAERKASLLSVTRDQIDLSPADGYLIIHILEDGFTAFERVWNKGQEIHIKVDGEAWKTTVNINGESWLDLSEEDQRKRWGKVIFRRGTVPNEVTESFIHVNDISEIKLNAEERLGERVPVKSVLN